MTLIYRGTTREFYYDVLRKKGVYTHETRWIRELIRDLSGCRLFNDAPFPHIFFSTRPSNAIVHAISNGTKYRAMPILLQADSDKLVSNGMTLDQISKDTFLMWKGRIPPKYLTAIDFPTFESAYKLQDVLLCKGSETDEKIVLEEFQQLFLKHQSRNANW